MGKNSRGGPPQSKKPAKAPVGPDIPSSNFMAKSAVNASRSYSNVTNVTNNAARSYTSVSNVPIKAEDPNKVLSQLSRTHKNISEIVGPTLYDLKQQQKERLKREEARKKMAQLEARKNPEVVADRAKQVEAKKKEEEEKKQEEKQKKIFTDESGRIVDEEGNVVNLKPTHVSSLKVNVNRQKEKRVQEMMRLQRTTGQASLRNTQFFDNSIINTQASKREKRRLHAFHFIQKGSISQRAETLRQNDPNAMEEEKPAVDGAEKPTADADTSVVEDQKKNILQTGVKRVSVRVKRHDPIPDIEWWDAPLVQEEKKSYVPKEVIEATQPEEEGEGDRNEYGSIQQLKNNLQLLSNLEFATSHFKLDKISALVEHPSAFRNNLSGQHIVIPMYLTEEERKKMRRKKRLEKEKEKQDKIRLGLIQPPPPKLKLTNFMRVLGNEAVADPTKVEQDVRRQVEERLRAHKERNAKKKLTKDQKAEKALRKLKRDSALECRVAIFRVTDMSNRSNRFKVDTNANQLAINGFCIVADKNKGINIPSVVIVEGGPKTIKFYKKLMLRRIKWGPESEDQNESNATENMALRNSKYCQLVWEGAVKDHSFNKWRVIDIKSELEGRRALAERGVEFYWDMALNNKAIDDEDEHRNDNDEEIEPREEK